VFHLNPAKAVRGKQWALVQGIQADLGEGRCRGALVALGWLRRPHNVLVDDRAHRPSGQVLVLFKRALVNMDGPLLAAGVLTGRTNASKIVRIVGLEQLALTQPVLPAADRIRLLRPWGVMPRRNKADSRQLQAEMD
jgi:hypothetical protein